jgi:hypothetical protein
MIPTGPMKILVAGWFSFENCGATAGDILCRDLVCGWLREESYGFDVACVAPFDGDVDWRHVDPADYSHVIFVCGPFIKDWPGTEFLARFSGRRMMGLNLSMIAPLGRWNPFDVLWERDSDLRVRPDLTFSCAARPAPVAGLILVKPQHEYGGRGRHEHVNEQIRQVLSELDIAIVPIDTMIEWNSGGLRSVSQIDSLIGRMDFVITTRLHGMVLALRQGVPAVVVDPIAGGAKITAQAEMIGWKLATGADALSAEWLRQAVHEAQTQQLRHAARTCSALAVEATDTVRTELLEYLRT